MKYILLLLFITSFTTHISAQKHIVRGTVKDDMGGVVGATVAELDANKRVIQGTITNIDGDYTIQISSPNGTIQYSFIGTKTVLEKVNGRSTIDVTLVSDDQMVGEVTVTAARTSSSLTGVIERDQTGSSAIVKMDGVMGSVVSSVDDALQGAVAGLDIMGGGSPGSGSSITIRGLGSLGGSSPLIVVDGIVQKVSTANVDFASADTEDIGSLVSIAPADIAEVRVLKDAAETAVYGTQGANGVLEITTNKGSRGKTRFDVDYKKSYSFESPSIPMLNGDEYVMLQQEMYHNRHGVIDLPKEISNDPEYLDYYNYGQNTDWVKEITQIGEVDDFGFRISGGGDRTRYYASVNYQKEIGTVKNTANSRFTTRINVDYKISTKLNLNTQISYVNSYKDDNWEEKPKEPNKNNVRSLSYKKAPNMSIYKYTSDGERTDEFFTPLKNYQGDGVQYFNPSAVVAFSDNDQARDDFQTNFKLTYNLNRWLTLKETVSFQFQNSKNMEFLPYTAIGAKWLDDKNNFSKERNTTGTLLSTQFMANFTAIKNGVHSLNGFLMFETRQDEDEFIETSTGNGPSTLITDPASSPNRTAIQSGLSIINSVGILGQVHYKLLDRHMFQVNVRSDASSSFGESSRWGTFPSASYAWRFSGEPFLAGWTFLDDSKLRFSYGLAGSSNVKAYSRHGIYESINRYMDISSVIPKQAQLQKLKWESSTMLNIGIELSFFKNRFELTGEYYDRITDDNLWPNYKVPSSSGYDKLEFYNDGSIQNTGYEFTTRVTAIRQKDWNVNLNFNIYFNKNQFLSFPANIGTEKTDISNGKYPLKAEIGKPVGSFFGFRYLGVYPTTADAVAHNKDGSVKLGPSGKPIPMSYGGAQTRQFEGGDAKYQDINNDGIIDLDDVVYLGDSNPDFAGGFGFSVKYKRLVIVSSFLYRYGFDIVNEVALSAESMTNTSNQSKAVLNRWRVPGQDFPNILPRAYLSHPANNLGSDRYVEDASFLRLNNISLTYSFGDGVLKALNLNSFKVGIQARKLMTLTNYTGQDPEVQMKKDEALWYGKDDGTVPPPIFTAINVSISF